MGGDGKTLGQTQSMMFCSTYRFVYALCCLGGLIVVGPGSQGILYTYNEKVYGDHAPKEQILEALKKMRA
jgi:hypothetical protein